MNEVVPVNVTSEIGKLEVVLIHTPGPEVESMTPGHAERALYSDILNLSVVSREYRQFREVLCRFAGTLEVRDLLTEVLADQEIREELISRICEPVILNRHDFQTVHIVVDNGEVAQIFEEQDLLAALDRLGLAMKAIRCGGGGCRCMTMPLRRASVAW